MSTWFILILCITFLIYKLGNRILDIYEYKFKHTKREDRWQW